MKEWNRDTEYVTFLETFKVKAGQSFEQPDLFEGVPGQVRGGWTFGILMGRPLRDSYNQNYCMNQAPQTWIVYEK